MSLMAEELVSGVYLEVLVYAEDEGATSSFEYLRRLRSARKIMIAKHIDARIPITMEMMAATPTLAGLMDLA